MHHGKHWLNGLSRSTLIDVRSSKITSPKDRITRLFQAAGKDDVEEIRSLVAAGMDPNAASPYGHIPLRNACFAEATRAAEVLIQLGANPNKRFTVCSPSRPFTQTHESNTSSHVRVSP